MVKNFTMGASEQKDASLESPFGVSEQKDTPLESPLRVSEQKDAPLESPLGVSEQKDAPLESPLRVSEQKDASLECPLGASEQKDASLESPFGASEQKDAPLESPLGASEQKDTSLESPTAVSLHQRPLKWFPTAAPSGHWPLRCFPTAAPSGQRLPKCFPTAANGWRSPLSAGRVGAYCIRPQTIRTRNSSVWLEGALICNCPCRGIGWGVCNTPLLLGTPLGHPPIKWFPTRANEWRSPLSAGRVGRKSIRPRCSKQETAACVRKALLYVIAPAGALGGAYAFAPYPDGRQRADTPKMFSDGGAFASAAPKMFSNDSAFGSAAPIIFFRENCNKRRASASQ